MSEETEEAFTDWEILTCENEYLTKEVAQLQSENATLRAALELLANDPITSGASAHYRDDSSGAYNKNDKRIDALENARLILQALQQSAAR
jgi:hypothetical protein